MRIWHEKFVLPWLGPRADSPAKLDNSAGDSILSIFEV